jgi:hypothetical protein
VSDEKHDRDSSITASQHQETGIAGSGNVVTRPLTGAERAKAFRRRKRDKFKSIRFDVHDSELDVLAQHGLLPVEQRNHQGAISDALGKLVVRAIAALEAGSLPK